MRASSPPRRRTFARTPRARPSSSAAMGPGSAEAFHYRIEAMRRGFVDRTSLGDPAFVENPLARLLDKAYAKEVRESIDPAKAARSRELKAGSAPHEGANTTHYSIV